jgi:internalin A
MSESKDSIRQLIKNAKENNVKKINYYGDEDIPDEIFDLTFLEELKLTNKFSEKVFFEKIQEFKNLTELNIDLSYLSEFPKEIMEIKSLTRLFLSGENLFELPEKLNNWDTLEYLYLGGCKYLKKINGLPPNLNYLYVDGLKFSEFPKKIFKLKKINKLVAMNFNLRELPLELTDMSSLRALFLGKNKLSKLPNEIIKLNNLNYLWLNDNLFEVFPKIITEIKSLTALKFSGNKLSKIPASIKKLKNIEYLDFGGNLFKEIPKYIFDFKELKELSFGNYNLKNQNNVQNNITIIPIDILKLQKLKELNLYNNNNITNIPDVILSEGVDSIKNFIQSKLEADKEEYLYEAKMVMVGRGDVGKSVLTKKLSDPSYSLTISETTPGIKVLKNPYEFTMKGLKGKKSFRFNIWDFGGQEKYDATHQLFITKRSVYIFLTEARAESNYQDVFYWLNTISLLSHNSPVIVVLSKYDERKKILPESIYKEKFKNIIQFVDVSCADGFEHTIENLKDAIKESIKKLPQTNLTLSNHWVDIREKLEKLSINKDYIDYNQYLDICKTNKLDKKKADFLSEYLNDLGVIVHKQDDLLLKQTVFINTDWCVDGMYKVLDDETVFNNNGRFTNSDLEKIWEQDRFKGKQAELIRLMGDYGLCFPLSDNNSFIAPELLPPDKPSNIIWNYESTLQFEYQYNFMPAGMVSRFIVKSHSFIKEELYWKYGVVLSYDNTEAIIEEDYINSKIKISLRGENKKGLLSAIKMFIEEVHKDYDKDNKLEFSEMVPCNCSECIENDIPHFYKFKVLNKWERKSIKDTHCEESGEPVKIKNLINDVQVSNPAEYFETDEDLKDYIFDLLGNVLDKDIGLKGGNINFWRDQKCTEPKNETEIQPYICNTLDNYCRTKGINLAREVQEANGSVDILFSCTNKENQLLKVCVEIKKAHHQDIETAIETQLPIYMKSAGTNSGIYLVIWYKGASFNKPTKFKTEIKLENSIINNNPDIDNISIKILNCSKRISPSKRKKITKS